MRESSIKSLYLQHRYMRIEILYRYYQILTHSEGGRGALSNLIFVIISCDIEVL